MRNVNMTTRLLLQASKQQRVGSISGQYPCTLDTLSTAAAAAVTAADLVVQSAGSMLALLAPKVAAAAVAVVPHGSILARSALSALPQQQQQLVPDRYSTSCWYDQQLLALRTDQHAARCAPKPGTSSPTTR